MHASRFTSRLAVYSALAASCVAVQAAWGPEQLMAELARRERVQATFVEAKYLRLLSRPLEKACFTGEGSAAGPGDGAGALIKAGFALTAAPSVAVVAGFTLFVPPPRPPWCRAPGGPPPG